MKRKKTKDPRGGPGRNQGRKAEDGVRGVQRLNVTLDDESARRARELGDGNVSLGIRKAIAAALVILAILFAAPAMAGGRFRYNCGIGRWINNVWSCPAGPVEQALDRLNDTVERAARDKSAADAWAAKVRAIETENLRAEVAAANLRAQRAAAAAANANNAIRAMQPPARSQPPPQPLSGRRIEPGEYSAAPDVIYKRTAPNGTPIYSNVQ